MSRVFISTGPCRDMDVLCCETHPHRCRARPRPLGWFRLLIRHLLFFFRGLHHARFTVYFKPGAVALICWLRSVVLCPHRPLQHPPVKAIVIDNRAMANLWRSFLFYLVFLFRPSACCCSWKYPSDYAIKYHTRISTRCSNFLLCSSLLAPCCATESTLSSCPL